MKIFPRCRCKIIAAIEENRNDLPGVAILSESKRVYDFRGRFSASFWLYQRNCRTTACNSLCDYYRPGDAIGYTGIEAGYENFPRGRKGIEFAAVNVLGQRVSSFNNGRNDVAPEDGFSLKLGIDAKLAGLY